MFSINRLTYGITEEMAFMFQLLSMIRVPRLKKNITSMARIAKMRKNQLLRSVVISYLAMDKVL